MNEYVAIGLHVAGFLGACTLLAAYGLSSAKKIEQGGWKFQLMNMFGALLVAINAIVTKDWSSAFLEISWATIAIACLVSLRKSRSDASE